MGIIRAEILLENPVNTSLGAVKAAALVDTGALHLCLPEHLAIQLGLVELEKREVTLADGHKKLVPYVGPVKISFQNRHCFVGAMVLGDEPLLGAIPMEDMDLMIHPSRRMLIVNPENPNIPGSLAKSTEKLNEVYGKTSSRLDPSLAAMQTMSLGEGGW